MTKFRTAALLALALPTLAAAQDTSPDGSRLFGFEPYVGVLGGYHTFDDRSELGSPRGGHMNGALVSGIAGANLPLGPGFVGVEGNGTKGFNDIRWEYGVKGRAGFRAGESGLVFLSAGYQWIDGRRAYPNRSAWTYGGGVEVGPKDIGLGGLTDNAGVRIRLQVDTYSFDSIRPMAGVVLHF